MNGKKREIPKLPKSDDTEFWGEEAEKYIASPVKLPICKTHSRKNWMKHEGYIDNRDGTATCKYCNWGFRIPGYLRILDEKVCDLRKI